MLRFILASVAALFAAVSMTGCLATGKEFRDGNMPNRLMMSVACDEMRLDSQWLALFGITSGIDKRDAAPILEKLCGGPAAKPAAPAASGAK